MNNLDGIIIGLFVAAAFTWVIRWMDRTDGSRRRQRTVRRVREYNQQRDKMVKQ
jgi:hypothetical protein